MTRVLYWVVWVAALMLLTPTHGLPQVTQIPGGAGAAAGVDSFNGRSGVVSPTARDYYPNQLGCDVIRTSASILTVFTGASATKPCNFRFGSKVYSLTSSGTVTISSGSGADTIYLYIANDGTLTFGNNAANTYSGSGVTDANPITAFPADSIPIWSWGVTAGAYDASGTDARAVWSTRKIVAGTGVVVTDSTSTGHVTLDVNAVVSTVRFTMGVCQGTTPVLGVSTPASNAPAAACITGTNTNFAAADFDAATDETIQGHFKLPTSWTGNIVPKVEWFAAATSGSVQFRLETVCIATSEPQDPSFNAAQYSTGTPDGTTTDIVVTTLSNATTTGCAAGETFYFRFGRDADGTGGTDDMTGDARVIALSFDLSKTL